MVTPAAIVAAPGLGHPVVQNIPTISPPIGPNVGPMLMRNKPINPPFVKNQFNHRNKVPIRVPGPNFAVPGIHKQKPKHKSNSTLSRTDPYYYLAPDKYPVKGPDFSAEIDDTSPSWQPYVNKKFFTTLPSTIKYKNPFFDSSPTSIKYVYKKVKDKKKKNKHKYEEDDHHSWFHGWNPFSCSEDEEEHSKESGDDEEEGLEDYSVEEGTEFSILKRKDKHKYKKKKKWILKILFGLLVLLGIKCLISRYFFAFFPAFFTTTARDEVPNESHIEDEGIDEFDRTNFISDRQLREYRSFFAPCYDETKIDFSLPSIRNRIKRILNFDEND